MKLSVALEIYGNKSITPIYLVTKTSDEFFLDIPNLFMKVISLKSNRKLDQRDETNGNDS